MSPIRKFTLGVQYQHKAYEVSHIRLNIQKKELFYHFAHAAEKKLNMRIIQTKQPYNATLPAQITLPDHISFHNDGRIHVKHKKSHQRLHKNALEQPLNTLDKMGIYCLVTDCIILHKHPQTLPSIPSTFELYILGDHIAENQFAEIPSEYACDGYIWTIPESRFTLLLLLTTYAAIHQNAIEAFMALCKIQRYSVPIFTLPIFDDFVLIPLFVPGKTLPTTIVENMKQGQKIPRNAKALRVWGILDSWQTLQTLT